jgi:glutamyl-tRNA synthetase
MVLLYNIVMTIRTRVAPSPTGFPHIGTIYQALFDYAYAKKNGGQFIVRIEDTDRTRFIDGAEAKIYEALDWFGLSEEQTLEAEEIE